MIPDTYHLHRAQIQSVLRYIEIRNRKPVNNTLHRRSLQETVHVVSNSELLLALQ